MTLAGRIRLLKGDIQRALAKIALWRKELAHEEVAARKHVPLHRPLPIYGIDYAWGRPKVATMRAHGVAFACRYLAGEGKALDRGEALRLSAAGIDLVSVWEISGTAMRGGAVAGKRDGRAAYRAARALGMPRGRPIYYACDFEAVGTDIELALAYLHAAKSAAGGYYPAGLYGGRAVIAAAAAAGVRYLWQTIGWSGSPTKWVAHAQLRQTSVTGPWLDGVECDTDWAQALDFGQWRL